MGQDSKDVKLSKRCQMSNSHTFGLYKWRRFIKKLIDIIRFTNIDINFDVIYEGHQNWSKYFLWTFWGFLVTIICDVKIDVNICEPHYVDLFFYEPPP